MSKPFQTVKDESPAQNVTDQKRRDPDRAEQHRVANSFAESALSSVNDVSVDDDVRLSDVSGRLRVVAAPHRTGADNSASAGILVECF